MTKKTVRRMLKEIIEFMLPLIIVVKRSVSLKKVFDFSCDLSVIALLKFYSVSIN